jgi:hypothetical protein
MQIVPVIATPNQIEAVPLDGQSYIVQVSQRSTGLYIDVFMNGEPIILGVLCENRNLIIRNVYLGATGDFYFVDARGRWRSGPRRSLRRHAWLARHHG